MKIISLTQPLPPHHNLSPEEWIVYQARISSPQNQHQHATGHRLLSYCLRNGHWSVFDMVDVTMELQTTRGIMAQVLRHHSFRFQEFSQRYANASTQFPAIEIREKHVEGNRQGSGAVSDLLTMHAQEVIAESGGNYEWLLENGAAPESARFVLPLATPTTAYMKGSVRSWITYFWQRCDPHAQKEHREMAEACLAAFSEHFPICHRLATEGRMRYVENTES